MSKKTNDYTNCPSGEYINTLKSSSCTTRHYEQNIMPYLSQLNIIVYEPELELNSISRKYINLDFIEDIMINKVK